MRGRTIEHMQYDNGRRLQKVEGYREWEGESKKSNVFFENATAKPNTFYADLNKVVN